MKNDIYNALGVCGRELASTLDHIGGSSQDIIDRVQGLYEAGKMVDIFTGEQMSIDECAKECMASLRGELVRVWVLGMARSTATSIMEAFANLPHAKIVLSKDVEIFSGELSAKWNDMHSDEEPVFAIVEDEQP